MVCALVIAVGAVAAYVALAIALALALMGRALLELGAILAGYLVRALS